MAKAKFRCKKCGRSFTMAAHLGRHMSTIHGAQAARKGAARGKVGGRGRRPMSVPTSGSRELMDLAGQMRARLDDLADQRGVLETQIDALNAALAALGGQADTGSRATGRAARPARAARPVRARGAKIREGSLKEYISRVLRQARKPMTPAEVSAGVVRAGYRTKAKGLPNMVSNALRQMRGVKKLRRGLYQLS